MPELTRSALVVEISNALADAETAIRSHPTATVEVYEKAVAAFEAGAKGAAAPNEDEAHGLTRADMELLNRYMLASSFMSAWWHLHGDKSRRDKAAQTASILIAGVGLDPITVMKRYLHFEHIWRKTLRAEGIAPRGALIPIATVAIIVGVLWLLLG